MDKTLAPPFLTKTFDLVDDPSSDTIISWSTDGTSFIVHQPNDFSRDFLPKYFKHGNFSSFVRQLNTYGFRKVDPDRWEFANDSFLRGNRDLLKEIHRRKPAGGGGAGAAGPSNSLIPVGAAIEVGHFGGFQEEIETLKRDKNVLMLELVRLRQAQSNSDSKMRDLVQRVETTEQRQNTMLSFFTSALQNPAMLQRLFSQVNTGNGMQRLTGPTGAEGVAGGRKKRRAPRNNMGGDVAGGGLAGNTTAPSSLVDLDDFGDYEMGGNVGGAVNQGLGAGVSNTGSPLSPQAGQRGSQIVHYSQAGGGGGGMNEGASGGNNDPTEFFLRQFTAMLSTNSQQNNSAARANAAPQVQVAEEDFSNAFDGLQLSHVAAQAGLGAFPPNPLPTLSRPRIDEQDSLLGSIDFSPSMLFASDSLLEGLKIGGDGEVVGENESTSQAHLKPSPPPSGGHQMIMMRTAAMAPPTSNMAQRGVPMVGLPAIATSNPSRHPGPSPSLLQQQDGSLLLGVDTEMELPDLMGSVNEDFLLQGMNEEEQQDLLRLIG